MKFQKTFTVLSIATVLVTFSLMGCNKQANAPVDDATNAAADNVPSIPPELEKYKDEIQKLPESEWAAVYKQKVCPVSGEPLGSMGHADQSDGQRA